MDEQLDLELKAEAPTDAERAALRRLVPGAFVEGRLDARRLEAWLGDGSDPDDERYVFGWSGRAEALAALRRPATGTLAPDREQSAHFDDGAHVLVEGDNLAVLKLLLPAYRGQVKMIFIDPPYNTGHDFIYDDCFRDAAEDYLAQTGQLDDQGRRMSSRAEVDGRHHSRWLSMMAPRLALARQMMADDGAIFVSIDDREVHHLRLLMNEVFGEENFVAQITWQKRYTRSNNTERFTSVLDQILLYQRTDAFQPNLLPRPERDLVDFRNPDDDPRGPWKPTSFLNQVPPEKRPNLAYPITNPQTGQVTENDHKAWRTNREGYERLEAEGRLWWGKDGRRPVPQVKTYLSEIRQGVAPINFWSYQYAGHTDLAHDELRALFGRKVFDTPKPTLLVRRMLEHATGPSDLVLDFFAGSGTTAQAVMELNAEDGGDRRCVLVQLPEPLGEDVEFETICDITRARMRLVGDSLTHDGDKRNRGFRAYRLGPSHLARWPQDAVASPSTDVQALVDARAAGADSDCAEDVLLHEILLMAGVMLCAEIQSTEIAGHRVHEVPDCALVVCLDGEVDMPLFEALVDRRPGRVICRDGAFGGDALRIRAARLLSGRAIALETV